MTGKRAVREDILQKFVFILFLNILFGNIETLAQEGVRKECQRIEAFVQVHNTAELNKTIEMLEQSKDSSKKSEISLNKSNILKDQIITMVLHDLRSPVSYRETISQRRNFQVKKSNFPIQFFLGETMSIVLRNILDNANKNMKNGTIKITAPKHLNQTYILIANTDKGMTKDKIDRFIKASKAIGDLGIGSMIMPSMVQKLNRTLDIQSDPETTISIPEKEYV